MKITPDPVSANILLTFAQAYRAMADIFLQASIEARAPVIETAGESRSELVAAAVAAEGHPATTEQAPGKRGAGRPRKAAAPPATPPATPPAVAPDTTPERAAGLTPSLMPQPGPTPPAAAPAPAPGLSYDDVRPTLIKVLEAKGEQVFVAMLAEFGVANAKLLPVNALPAVLARAKALLQPAPAASAMEGLL